MKQKIFLIFLFLIISLMVYSNEKQTIIENTNQYIFKNTICNVNPLIKKCSTRLLNGEKNNEDKTQSSNYLKSSRGFLAMGIIGLIFTVSAAGFLVFGGLVYLLIYISKIFSGGIILSGIPFAVAGLVCLFSIPLTIAGFIAFAALRKKYKRSRNGSKISYNEYNRQIEYDLYYSVKI